MSTYHSPAEIVRQHLKDLGVGSLLEDKSNWPMYVSSMPDMQSNNPDLRTADNVIVLNDTQGVDQGRLMCAPYTIIHKPGLQVRARAEDYPIGWRKINDVANSITLVNNNLITLADESGTDHLYIIKSITRTSPPSPNGTETGTKRRELFSVNYIVNIEELELAITLWDTQQAGSANDTLELPMASSSTIFVDWGDGVVNNEVTHTYSTPGIYTVNIHGNVTTFQFANSGDREKLLDVSKWGGLKVALPEMFNGCTNLDISATAPPDIVTDDLHECFTSCSSLTGGLANWNMTGVKDVGSIFTLCNNYNEDISGWDTSTFEDVSGMFGNMNFNQDISNWDMSSVINMVAMFGLNPSFNQDISNWDVSNVTDFSGLFTFAQSFNQNLNSWNTAKATNMDNMFLFAFAYNQPMDQWDVSNVEGMLGMFLNAITFNQDLSSWDVSKVTDLTDFLDSTAFSQANYDLLLPAWSLLTLQPNVQADFGSAEFGPAAPSIARKLIKDTYNWNINDGGGNDLAINGDFTSASDWGLNGTSFIAGGILTVGGLTLFQGIATQSPDPTNLNAGHTYTISYEVLTNTSGGGSVPVVGGVLGTETAAIGIISQDIVAGSGFQATGIVSGFAVFEGTIDNISWREK